MTLPIRLIHVSIQRAAADVYAYAADPRHLPEWATGLSHSPVQQAGEYWLADSPMGKVKIKFAAKNVFGVLDHDVTLPDGTAVHNPLRVQPNGSGAEAIFTLYRQPGVDDAAFEADAAHVRGDLEKLKAIMEAKAQR